MDTVGIFENLNIKDKDTAAWEILIMLLGAFLLGYLLRALVCRAKCSTKNAAMSTSTAAPVAAAAATPRTVKPDDLTIVEGIGPKINELLQNGGIRTFADLANATPARLKTILIEAGPRYKMHDPKTWPKQASLADEGRMDELEALKDRLSGGR